jgi:indolepyruvate decarboxylase
MKDILAELTRRITNHTASPPVKPAPLGPVVGGGSDPITAEALYPRWANFLKPNDLLFTETGTSAMGLAFALLSRGATYHHQALSGWIGWATPAAFGAAVAAPTRRVVLVTGDGSQAPRAAERGGAAAYIEVVTDAYAASPLAMKLHESVKRFYSRSN